MSGLRGQFLRTGLGLDFGRICPAQQKDKWQKLNKFVADFPNLPSRAFEIIQAS